MTQPFLFVGAMKSGTTTFHDILCSHPDVDVVTEKESSSLSTDAGARELAVRVARSGARTAGEVSAGYMQAPLMPQPVDRADEVWGDTFLLLAVVRNPFDRAVSHWEHWTHLGREDRPLSVSLLDDRSPYVAFSRYHAQLARWADHVGDSRVLILRLEDYGVAAEETLSRMWDFLEVPARPAATVHANAGSGRVVATGWRATVSRSRAYRTLVRPVLPAALRRRAVAVAGGARARITADVPPGLRDDFCALVTDDQAALARRWPGTAHL